VSHHDDNHSARLAALCTAFKLTTLVTELARRMIDASHADVLPLLVDVFQLEADARHERRIDRLRKASKLPVGKKFETFDDKRLPRPLASKLRELRSGAFLERAANVLCFGLPGVGKSHAAAALGHALVERGHSVLFVPASQLVQELLAAKRDLRLPRALKSLDSFELLILDDIGYVQQAEDEADVLFTLMSERYERGSMLITSNLVFAEWSRIFKNPMTAVAAADRLVHHSVILEFNVPSFRTETAKKKTAIRDKNGGDLTVDHCDDEAAQ